MLKLAKLKAGVCGVVNAALANAANIFGYVGAAVLAVAPFFFSAGYGYYMALCALICLLPQGFKLRAWNIVASYIVGIAGYTWTLFL